MKGMSYMEIIFEPYTYTAYGQCKYIVIQMSFPLWSSLGSLFSHFLSRLCSGSGDWGGHRSVPQGPEDQLGASVAWSDCTLCVSGLLDKGYPPGHRLRT